MYRNDILIRCSLETRSIYVRPDRVGYEQPPLQACFHGYTGKNATRTKKCILLWSCCISLSRILRKVTRIWTSQIPGAAQLAPATPIRITFSAMGTEWTRSRYRSCIEIIVAFRNTLDEIDRRKRHGNAVRAIGTTN